MSAASTSCYNSDGLLVDQPSSRQWQIERHQLSNGSFSKQVEEDHREPTSLPWKWSLKRYVAYVHICRPTYVEVSFRHRVEMDCSDLHVWIALVLNNVVMRTTLTVVWFDIHVHVGGRGATQWNDMTGSVPLTITDDQCVSFTSNLSARYYHTRLSRLSLSLSFSLRYRYLFTFLQLKAD